MRILFLGFLLASLGACTSDPDAYDTSIPTLALNGLAKNMCSCVFVSKNREEFCREYSKIKQADPKIEVNHQARKVKTSLFYFFTGGASYLGERLGCALDHGE